MTADTPTLETSPRWWATRRGQLLLAAVTAAVITAVAIPRVAMRRMMDARTATEDALATAAPGERVDVAIEIASANEESLSGVLLERVADARYRRTQRTVAMRWTAATQLVMGSRDEIRPGAVVQARGRLCAGAALDADRLVVLTGHVEVP